MSSIYEVPAVSQALYQILLWYYISLNTHHTSVKQVLLSPL